MDDITFSTNRSDFPSDVAASIAASDSSWQLSLPLVSEIQNAGFDVNRAKTRMQFRGSRQLTTGLLVNEKVNIRPEYYRTVRSMCSALFSTGKYYQMMRAPLLGGAVGGPDVKQETRSLSPLQGRLSHIYHVRNSVDRRESADKKKNSTATRRLYHRFLFYKNFVALEKPLIISEGRTDSIYLKAAIARSPAFQPRLGKIENGKLRLAIRFLNQTSAVHDVLQLGGGTGDFKFFMLRYRELVGSFKHRPLSYPVILLIDNDDGANEIFSVAKQLGVSSISHASTAQFYRIHANLYLFKTPETGSLGNKTCIENFFAPSVLATELEGKKFDPNKKHEEAGKYGKAHFAERVIRPQMATIDFGNFSGLLNRLISVIDDYKANPTAK